MHQAFWHRVTGRWVYVALKTRARPRRGTMFTPIRCVCTATPGIHYPESRCYIRRVRLSAHSELVKPLQDAGFHVEPAVEDADNTVVVSFPVDVGEGVRTCVASCVRPAVACHLVGDVRMCCGCTGCLS